MTKIIYATLLCLFIGNTQYATENSSLSIRPADVLADGCDGKVLTNEQGKSAFVRKGTVAASWKNISTLNELLKKPESLETLNLIESVIKTQDELTEGLELIGMFKFFSPKEWTRSKKQLGRTLVALRYITLYPLAATSKVKLIINKLLNHKHSIIRNYAKKALQKLEN